MTRVDLTPAQIERLVRVLPKLAQGQKRHPETAAAMFALAAALRADAPRRSRDRAIALAIYAMVAAPLVVFWVGFTTGEVAPALGVGVGLAMVGALAWAMAVVTRDAPRGRKR